MNHKQIVGIYVEKLNSECLYSSSPHVNKWEVRDLEDLKVAKYCAGSCNTMRVLCRSCYKNLDEFKRLTNEDEPFTIERSRYLNLLKDLQYTKMTLSELKLIL